MKFVRKMSCLAMVMMILMSMSTTLRAAEAERISSSVIPDTMQPYTTIQFVSDNSYKVVQGGTSEKANVQEKLLKENMSEESIQMEKECKANGTAQEAIVENYPKPEVGMTVIYGSDGLVTEILDRNGEEVDPSVEVSNIAEEQIMTASTGATKVKIASWGSSNNRLYRKTSSDGTKKIVGYGRATTFSDTYGQRDHKLVKGDVATKKAYDNCKYGITVKVKAKKKGSSQTLTKSMKKCDVGSMPNAIVDIWKTGVEYWGYTYSSSLSLNGEVKIWHADSY